MARRGKLPFFEKLYPDVSREIIIFLQKTERKIQYQEYDIKVPQTYRSRRTGKIVTLPPLEISLNRIVEAGYEIPDKTVDIENSYIERIQRKELYEALGSLSECDLYLIIGLFFEDKTERKLADELHVTQSAIHKRKKKILYKMQKKLAPEVVRMKRER